MSICRVRDAWVPLVRLKFSLALSQGLALSKLLPPELHPVKPKSHRTARLLRVALARTQVPPPVSRFLFTVAH